MKKNNLITRLAVAVIFTAGTLLSPLVLAQSSEKPYTFVEQMPTFEGGDAALMKFMGENMRYPEDAKKDSIEGLVVVEFVVDKDGSLDDAKVLKSLSTSTDAEALRVVRLMDGKWQPGTQDGKAVAVRYVLPIRYAMDKKEKTATAPDRQPSFKGGQEALFQAITQHLKMPEEAKQEHLNARVVVQFMVGKDGSVSDIHLAKTKLKKTIGPGSDLDYMDATTFNLQNKAILAKLSEAALAAVQATSGQWEPATTNGQPVAAELTLPLQFMGAEAEKAVQPFQAPAPQKEQPQEKAYKDDETKGLSTPDKEALYKFLGKNIRYPRTSKQGTATVKFEITDAGYIHYQMSPGFDEAMAEEVLRVLKMAKDQDLLQKGAQGMQSLTIKFRIDDGKPAAVATGEPADVVVTKYR